MPIVAVPAVPREGFLSYPAGGVLNSNNNTTNSQCIVTLPAVAGKTTYLEWFAVTTSPITGASVANAITVANLANNASGGTLTIMLVTSNAASGWGGQLIVQFPQPIPANAANTAISITIPAVGTGVICHASIHGFVQ